MELLQPYADQGMSFFMELVAMGKKEAKANSTFSVTEEARYNQTFGIAANVGDPGAGNSANINVAAANTENAKVFARVGDIVFAAGASPVHCRVEAKSEAGGVVTLTIKPLKAAENIGALTAASTTFVILSSAWAEGTDQPEAAAPKTVRYSMNMQIIKEHFSATGTVLTDWTWVPVREDGASIPTFYSQGTLAAEYRQQKKIDGALMYGVEADNLGDVNTTKGIIPVALDSDGYLGAQTLDIAGFQAIGAYLRKVYAPQLICGYLGNNKYNEFENNAFTLAQNTNIEAARRAINEGMYGGMDAFELNHQFQAIITNGRTFKIQSLNTLDDPTIFNTGASGEEFQDYGIFIPASKTTDGNNKPADYIALAHKSYNGYDRIMEVWEDGAAGPGLKIGTLDSKSLHLRSDVGLSYRKTQQWAMVK